MNKFITVSFLKDGTTARKPLCNGTFKKYVYKIDPSLGINKNYILELEGYENRVIVEKVTEVKPIEFSDITNVKFVRVISSNGNKLILDVQKEIHTPLSYGKKPKIRPGELLLKILTPSQELVCISICKFLKIKKDDTIYISLGKCKVLGTFPYEVYKGEHINFYVIRKVNGNTFKNRKEQSNLLGVSSISIEVRNHLNEIEEYKETDSNWNITSTVKIKNSQEEELNNLSTKNKEKMNKKSNLFSGMLDKMKSQFMPVKFYGPRMTMDGQLAILAKGEYVAIDANNTLVAYPEAMTVDMPTYIITKPTAQLVPGDIVMYQEGKFAKVLGITKAGNLSLLSYVGTTMTKKEIKDYILGQATMPVVMNLFAQTSATQGFNPMMMLALGDGEVDMKELLMLQMMQGGNGASTMNPMMLMALSGDGFGEGSMMETMMMMQMMGGQNPFASMFPAAPVIEAPKASAKKK